MDEKEVRRVVETYSDMILRISYSYLKQTFDAQDICQTVLLKYLTLNEPFDTREHEKAWIIRSTINACHDLRKSAFFKHTVELDEAQKKTIQVEPISEVLEEVKRLPLNYRISIYLYYYEGYGVKEIAALLGKKESAVSKYLSRGRAKLKIALSDLDEKIVRTGE